MDSIWNCVCLMICRLSKTFCQDFLVFMFSCFEKTWLFVDFEAHEFLKTSLIFLLFVSLNFSRVFKEACAAKFLNFLSCEVFSIISSSDVAL